MAARIKKMSNAIVWAIMALLFVGLAGFGATNFSGTRTELASVGETTVSVNDYARALQQEMRALQAQTGSPVTMQQAQQIGLDRQVLGQLVQGAALDEEARKMGLSVGDETVLRQLSEMSAFQGADGSFSRDAYKMALEGAGYSEAEFEAKLRAESARTLLQAAALSGSRTAPAYTEALTAWLGERRSFSWARLEAGSLPEEVALPEAAALEAWYSENIARYTRPESKRITYTWLTPDMLAGTVEIDEAILRDAYAARSDEYNIPERRMVEQLAFSNAEAADSAAAQLAVNGTSFDALLAERNLTPEDADLGEVTRADLGPAADAVFAGEEGAIVGPVETDLGPALFRINAVLEADVTPFEEARGDIEDEARHLAARQRIEAKAEALSDLLAGGATLEDVANESEMKLGELLWNETVEDDIAAYGDFRSAAAALTTDAFPELAELEDGGLYAMRLDETVPAAPIPYAEVADQVAKDWIAAETMTRLQAAAEVAKTGLAEGKTFAGVGLVPFREGPMTRRGFVGDAVPALLPTAFELDKLGVATLPAEGAVLVVQVTDIQPVDESDPDIAAARRQISEQGAADVAQDLYQALARDVQSRAGIIVDQQAMTAVAAQMN